MVRTRLSDRQWRTDGPGRDDSSSSEPFGTQVQVENLDNGRTVTVRANDRGPFVGERIIDVSKAAAKGLGMILDGVAKVRISP